MTEAVVRRHGAWRSPATAVLTVALGFAATAPPAHAACPEVLADLDASGITNVIDVQCSILMTLWALGGTEGGSPACVQGSPEVADINCDAIHNVVDVQLTIQAALIQPLSPQVDTNANGCVDACEEACTECPEGCGDGEIDEGEACDDGTLNSDTEPDACRTDCSLPGCGDGVVDTDEGCDGGPACTAGCALAANCGDGNADPGEECDEGALNSDTVSDACRTDCSLPTCGDGVLDTGEQCDDASLNNDVAPDACRTDCSLPYCGDAVLDTGEICDDGALNSDEEPNACRLNCVPAGCGDGIIDAGEACDDGFLNSSVTPDACRLNCALPVCGDNVTDTGEECDGQSGCSPICTANAGECGDGEVNFGEQCDGGPECAVDCTLIEVFTPGPGDLVITEIMADPEASSEPAGEWFEVVNTTSAGLDLDGLVIRDDGLDQTVVGNGSPLVLEAGDIYVFGASIDPAQNGGAPVDYAYGSTSLSNIADDIILEFGGVEIDRVSYSAALGFPLTPGTAMLLDASAIDPVENDSGAVWCVGSVAFGAGDNGSPGLLNAPCPVCGNGLPEAGEECDDENAVAGDGCENNCTLTPLAQCGNGFVEGEEECDDGPLNSDTEPNACRTNCVAASCGDSVVDIGEECDGDPVCDPDCFEITEGPLAVGALVISEIMFAPLVDPEVEGEWFEVYNTTAEAIDVDGLVIHDGADELHVVFSQTPLLIGPGDFLVFGSNQDQATNGGVAVDYEYFGVSLDNDSDTISLVVELEIDRVDYSTDAYFSMFVGASLSLAPGAFDEALNDAGLSWCPGESVYGAGGTGTPGAPNPACPVCGDGIPEGYEMCDDGLQNSDTTPDACRTDCQLPTCGDDVVDTGEVCDSSPGCNLGCDWAADQPGVLVITEIMADPGVADDVTGDWFELLNVASEAIVLNGMVIRDDGGEIYTVDDAEILLIDPGQYLVVGAHDDPVLNGGLPVDLVVPGLTLDNDADEIIVEFQAIEMDRVEYGPGFPIEAGASMNLDPSATDDIQNDLASSWCKGLVLFGTGDLGTPGQPNVSCPVCGNGIFELGEQCDQGELNSDTVPDACRTDCTLPGCGDGVQDSTEECDGGPLCSEECLILVTIKPGDIVITEIMNNPAAVSDSKGEWLEVFNATNDELDLDGVALIDDGVDFHYIDNGGPLLIGPGERLVLASNGDPAVNGGIVADYVFDPQAFSMSNGFDEVVLWNGLEIDRVNYDDGATFPDEPGVAMSLEPSIFDTQSNDLGFNWCLASSPYGSGDLGTPGADNDACPVCGNNIPEPGEACDDGNVTPGDGCEPDCTPTPSAVCGNGIPEVGEDCDDGVNNSDTEPDACRSDCTLPSCGDGVIDSGEACDGGEGCLSNCEQEVSLVSPGELVITEIMHSPSGVDSTAGSWFEITSVASIPVDLNGATLMDNDGQAHVIAAGGPLTVDPGGTLVFGGSGDQALNGGVPVDYVYSDFDLDPGGDEIVVWIGEEIDRVEYGVVLGFPDANGISLSLDPAFLDATFNDYGMAWCVGLDAYGSGGKGSPGATNGPCPICGDGQTQGNEVCDDGNIFPGDGCDFACNLEGALPGPSDLVITEIMSRPKAVDQSVGEWIELLNDSGVAINLHGLELRDDGSDSHVIDAAILLQPGEYVVLGIESSPFVNGGVTVDYEYDAFVLDDSGDEVVLERDGFEIDAVGFDGGSTFPSVLGAAMSLHPAFSNTSANDNGASWCPSSVPLPLGDFGTPGESNPPCAL